MAYSINIYDFTDALGYPIRVEINDWNSAKPLHWASFSDDHLITEGQFLQSPGLPLVSFADREGRRLFDTLPDSVAAIAALMPSMHFALAQACVTSEAAQELAEDAPLLLIFAVDFARKKSLSIEAFNLLLSCKRKEILNAVGLPGRKSIARLIRRIALSPLIPRELDDIRACLQRPAYLKLMQHHPQLHINHIRLLCRIRQPLWPGLLHLADEDTSATDLHWLRRLVRDTTAMTQGNERALSAIDSTSSLQAKHGRLIGQCNRSFKRIPAAKRQALAQVLAKQFGQYPLPPLAAIEGIAALRSWLDLLEEGANMHHCVGSHASAVAQGEVFIYRMLHPERLTIAVRYQHNTWVLDEVRGAGNATPTSNALHLVNRWVAASRNP